jgi:hypothetical protein
MTPQSTFMIVAPIQQNRVGAMRELLASMNSGPGIADPNNALIPFAKFDNLHFARLVVLDDQTLGDPAEFYGIERPDPPIYLAFLGDFDGSYHAFIDRLVKVAAPGLRQIFSLCEGFSKDTDLRAWVVSHEAKSSASYCNWVGRTVQQTKEEEALRVALRAYIDRSPEIADSPAGVLHQSLHQFVQRETKAGNLKLTPPEPTPLGWNVRHIFDWATLVLVLVVIFGAIVGVIWATFRISILILPIAIIPLAILAWMLRSHENSDPEFAPLADRQLRMSLDALEDYDVTNQFSAMGSFKPGWLRSLIVRLALFVINITANTVYTQGRLTRIHTIHFARWVFLDNRARMFFASNYDGSLESYNEDFINKVSIGLNLIFGNGIGYPRTAWLISKGAKDEQPFKYYLRRHELPTDVWFNAHAGLTASDMQRNSVIRLAVEKASLSETEARGYVTLL